MSDIKKLLIETVKENGIDIASDTLKVVSTVANIYGKVKRTRIKMFLNCIISFVNELTAEDKELFIEYVNSDEGRQLLTDFIDSALRVSNTIPMSALALLFADYNSMEYGLNAKYHGIRVLPKMNNKDAILYSKLISGSSIYENALTEIDSDETVPYDTYITSLPVNVQTKKLFIDIKKLQSEGIILDDPFNARMAGEELTIVYGLSDKMYRLGRVISIAIEISN